MTDEPRVDDLYRVVLHADTMPGRCLLCGRRMRWWQRTEGRRFAWPASGIVHRVPVHRACARADRGDGASAVADATPGR